MTTEPHNDDTHLRYLEGEEDSRGVIIGGLEPIDTTVHVNPPSEIPLKYESSLSEIPGPNLNTHEPHFTIRGNDKLALDTLGAYLDHYVALNPNVPDEELENMNVVDSRLVGDKNYQSLKKIIEVFEEYQERFSARVKYPD